MYATQTGLKEAKKEPENKHNKTPETELCLNPYTLLTQETSLFYSIPISEALSQRVQQKHYLPGSVLFEQNSLGRDFYLILSGKAEVTQEISKKPELIRYLGPGQYFGDHSLVHHEPHRHTITAVTPLTVLTLSATDFMSLYHSSPQLRDRLETLGSIYQIPGKGFATLYIDNVGEHESVTALYKFSDGHKLTVSQHLDSKACTVALNHDALANQSDDEKIAFEDTSKARSREICLSQGKLHTINSYGQWGDLSELILRLLTCRRVKPWERALYKQEGKFQPNVAHRHSNEAVLCKCAGVTRGSIKQAIHDGHNNIKAISEATGASKTCGNCSPLLQEMIGFTDMQLVDVTSVKEVSTDSKSFRFRSLHGALAPSETGQHIRLQAFIDGKWVQRSYTLTSPPYQTDYYEITVKREPNGYFSRWLHDELGDNAIIRTSPPQGGYSSTIQSQNKPTVYLVAGIGVTPALAKLRNAKANKQTAPVYVDYSATTEAGIICREELEDIERHTEDVFINFRTTRDRGHINNNTIKQINQHFPDASYIVCGPPAYESAVARLLTEEGIEGERVHVDRFIDAKTKRANLNTQKENIASSICAALAMTAILMFILFPQVPYSQSVLAPTALEFFWTDNFMQQVTGYSMMGIVLAGLFMSIRKRIKKIQIGRFAWWRVVHMLIGVTAVTLLFLHTGLSFGSNLNMVLGIGFVTAAMIGAATMTLKLVDLRRQSMGQDVARTSVNIIHILISATLPTVLAIHIFMTYYF